MKRILSLILIVALVLTMLIGCESSPVQDAEEMIGQDNAHLSDSTVYSFLKMDRNAYGKEQLFTEQSQAHFNKTQPPTKLDWSLERDNIDRRNVRWNDPNKVSYIYLLSDMGTILGFFPIKGKVSSVNSKLTTNGQVVDSYSSNSGVVESPSMDGSYGTNGDAVFFFLTDGTYMEWNGDYLLCDNPITLTQQPLMIYDIEE